MTALIKRLRPYFGLVALIAMVIYVATQWTSISAARAGIGWPFAIALFFSLLGVIAGGLGWSALSGLRVSVGLRIFTNSLPARYLPLGGFAQMAAQATISGSHGVEPWRALAAGPVFLVSLACGAVLVGTPLIFLEGMPGIATWSAIVGLSIVLALTAVYYGFMSWLVPAGSRASRLVASLRSLPFPRAVVWGTISVALTGAAWSVLLEREENWIVAIAIFAIGWLIGFFAVFVPAGVGIRESALVLMLPSIATPDVVASSLLLRFSVALSELVLIAVLMSATFASSYRKNRSGG